MDGAIFALLHILVLVYWLGGDLGAFYSSRFVTDPARTAKERMLAAGIVNAVDLAPRFSMIAALPTGLALGAVKGWLPLPLWAVGLAFAAAGVWAWVAWTLHLRHGPGADGLKKANEIWRWAFAAGLIGLGGAILIQLWPVAPFIGMKCLLLAATVLLGLRIRAQLKREFGPALVAMMRDGATPETDAALDRSLGAARPTVMMIWACLLLAAYLGVATPTFPFLP